MLPLWLALARALPYRWKRGVALGNLCKNVCEPWLAHLHFPAAAGESSAAAARIAPPFAFEGFFVKYSASNVASAPASKNFTAG